MARRPSVHQIVISKKAPKPIGPYSPAIKVKSPGEMLFVSGQIPIEMPSGTVFKGEIKRQAELALENMKNLVLDGGFQMDEIVKCTIFLTDMRNFDVVNEVYQKLFVGQMVPARAVVQVAGLPKEVGVEVECIAVKSGPSMDELLNDADFKKPMPGMRPMPGRQPPGKPPGK